MTTKGSGFDNNNLILQPHGDGTVTVSGGAPVTLPIETLVRELTSFLAESEEAEEKSLPLLRSHQGLRNPLAG
jgi:hypothetical protein